MHRVKATLPKAEVTSITMPVYIQEEYSTIPVYNGLSINDQNRIIEQLEEQFARVLIENRERESEDIILYNKLKFLLGFWFVCLVLSYATIAINPNM